MKFNITQKDNKLIYFYENKEVDEQRYYYELGQYSSKVKNRIYPDEFQSECSKTAIYPKEVGLSYVGLGLSGEVGEVTGIISKVYRDDNGIVSEEVKNKLKREIGDVCYFIAEMCNVLNVSFEEILKINVEKLRDRKERGVLQGSGDYR